MKRITHGSTFSGIGAPEVAAEMLGWQNVFHCEINPFGRSVLDYYFPKAESYEDITKQDFSKWRDKITVLTGGFPCQPFSYAGKRRGSEDDRYLWPFMLRCIQQVRPTWFVGENVAGITTMVFPGEDVKVGSGGSLFDQTDYIRRDERYVIEEICQQLEDCGYSVQPLLIPACAVGAPHRRDRVFFIAHRNDTTDSTSERRSSQVGQSGRPGQTMDGGSEDLSLNGACRPCDCRPTPDTLHRGSGEGKSTLESDLSGRNEPLGNGRESDVANTSDTRLQVERSQQQATRTTRNDEGQSGLAILGDTECTSEFNRQEREIQERYTYTGRICAEYLQPENRWRAFPTVSPVYRGNDGLPFNVDDLTIPFSQWKKESLKAYGNAIVVQVMYRIFEAINEIERH